MDINQFISDVNSVNWNEFGGSSFYKSEGISNTLIALARVGEQLQNVDVDRFDEEEAKLLYSTEVTNNLLSAIGNNHRGSYYPATRKALPFIIQIAIDGNYMIAKNNAIFTLIDLYHFSPECSDGSTSEEELKEFVNGTIKTMISENRDIFVKFAKDYPSNAPLVTDLLEIIDG